MEKINPSTATLRNPLASCRRSIIAAEFIFLATALLHFGATLFSIGGFAPEKAAVLSIASFPMLALSIAIYLYYIAQRLLLMHLERAIMVKYVIALLLLVLTGIISVGKVRPDLLPF